MKDFYLRFPDEYTALSSLSDFGTGQMKEFDTITEDLHEDPDDPELVTGTQEVTREVPELNLFTHEHAIDMIGTFYELSGNMLTDESGFEYPESVAINGYHINIRALSENAKQIIESKLSEYIVTPTTPNRIWA